MCICVCVYYVYIIIAILIDRYLSDDGAIRLAPQAVSLSRSLLYIWGTRIRRIEVHIRILLTLTQDARIHKNKSLNTARVRA